MLVIYVALLHKATKKSALYGVIFPDFPGFVSASKTVDEALKNAREGIVFHMEGMLENGELLPAPTPLEEILSNPDYQAATACLIHIVPPTGKLQRVNISIDIALLIEIDHAAALLGKNRSEFFAESARQMLI